LGALEISVDTNINTGLEKMYAQMTNLTSFAQWQSEVEARLLKDFKEKQQEQIKEMELFLQNQGSLREQQIAEAVVKLKSQVTTTIQDFHLANNTMKNNTKQIQNRVAGFSETALVQQNNLKQQFSATNNGVSQIIAAVQSSLDNSTVYFETELKALKQNAVTDRQACENLVNESQRNLVAKEKESSELTQRVVYYTNDNTGKLLNAMKSSNSITAELVQFLKTELLTSSDEATKFGYVHGSQQGVLQDGVVNFNYKSYNPTGETPMRKPYDYPQKLTHSRSETDILTAFRQTLVDPSQPTTVPPEGITIPKTPSDLDIDAIDMLESSPSPVEPLSKPQNVSSTKTKPKTQPQRNPPNFPLSSSNNNIAKANTNNNNKSRIIKGNQAQPSSAENGHKKSSLGKNNPSTTENMVQSTNAKQVQSGPKDRERMRLNDLTNVKN
jgi:hypothetical protein